MLRHGEGVFLDDLTPEDVSRELGVPQEQLTKSGGASFPIVGKTRKDGENA